MFAQDAPKNPAAEKMAELAWLLGSWETEVTRKMPGSSEEMKISGAMDCDWFVGKNSIKCDVTMDTAPGGGFVQSNVYTYNLDLKSYQQTAYGTAGHPYKWNVYQGR